ncbi:MAG: glycosyltransferase [Methylobacter sp.]|nr:glycosyltransferase [Methylobacter sp.]
MHNNRFHLLYFTAEQWPTFRPDVVALFGKYLPRYGITCDLVTERNSAVEDNPEMPWGGGQAVLCNVPRNRASQHLVKFWHNLRVLIAMDGKKYDAIQVRDMSVTALAGLIVARLKGIPFFYWLSYPQSEGQIDRAMARGIKGGMRFWFPLLQGTFGKWLLYRVVLPRSDHVFVQSRQMQLDVAKQGIPMSKMTPVPMGVDTEIVRPESIVPMDEPRFAGKRVVVYLGTLDPNRQIEILLQMLVHVRVAIPNILLVLVGDTTDASHREWLKQEAVRLGVAELVAWTGWLESGMAWRYARSAEFGLSPIPRGNLLDMGSPTKAVEYMALGLPVLVNDNPDQAQVIAESGAGLCVKLEPWAFAESVIRLLSDDGLRHKMGGEGPRYIIRTRAYDGLASAVAKKYHALRPERLP